MRSQGPRSAEGEGEPELLSVVRKVRTLLRMGAPDAEEVKEALRQALAWAQEGEALLLPKVSLSFIVRCWFCCCFLFLLFLFLLLFYTLINKCREPSESEFVHF
ncbi:unnamed protein product [Polarella glacialis]|uniref:Uncharacterized protein n=1 Tax=Polarella glacialis TaxID=89957 RepID=A0A813L551_POLGL|nr:unnamed protein product [Polarella glacialis]